MGYTQYWKHGTYRLDNGTFEDIEKLLRVSLKDARAIVGDEPVTEYTSKPSLSGQWVSTLGDVTHFEFFSRHCIRTNDFGETAVFYNDETALRAMHYIRDWEVDDFSYKEFCKPDYNELADAMLCAVLIAISMNNPDADISSDGNWCEDNWQAGAKLYELACGRKAECPRNVSLECIAYFKSDGPANARLSNGSPAYIHVYRDRVHVYAPYNKALDGDYASATVAFETLESHGYKEV